MPKRMHLTTNNLKQTSFFLMLTLKFLSLTLPDDHPLTFEQESTGTGIPKCTTVFH